jgi:Glycosyltransferase family 87
VAALLASERFILWLWVALAVFAAVKKFVPGPSHHNNFLIYEGVFRHLVEGTSLYVEEPARYLDRNHYGPVFGLLFAPFALLPRLPGMVAWVVANALALFFAIRALPLAPGQKVVVWYLVTNELFTSMVHTQVNPAIAASLVLAWVLIRREREGWAAAVIMLGALVKLYSIAGLAFVLFSRRPARLLLACLGWGAVLVVAPMLVASPDFVIRSYVEWGQTLLHKDALNASVGCFQDQSVLGLGRRLLGDLHLPSALFLVPGLLAYGLPCLRRAAFRDERFQLRFLAATLLFVVLFSSSAESPTYIIAFVGVALWFVARERPYPRIVLVLLALAMLLTSLSPLLLPAGIYGVVLRYSLKALPCLLVWLYATFELATHGLAAPGWWWRPVALPEAPSIVPE